MLKHFQQPIRLPWQFLAVFACFSIATAVAPSLMANDSSEQAVDHLDKSMRHSLIETLANKLEHGYVHAEMGANLAQTLREHQQSGVYAETTDALEFATLLTEQLQEASNDRHLRVDYSEDPIPEAQAGEDQSAEKAFEMQMWKAHNYGLEHFERMPFNIGYLKLAAFPPLESAASVLDSAMNLVANTNALIIDLRGNFGGYEDTGPYLTGYFLDERTHLLSMHSRDGDSVEQQWSSTELGGRHYGAGKDVYILIGPDTFSAAEAFSYTMKHLGRATLVGTTTAGAANAGGDVRLSEHFSVFLPDRQPLSPVTGTNWEGSGVTPDINIESDAALMQAQKTILMKLLEDEPDAPRAARIQARISELD